MRISLHGIGINYVEILGIKILSLVDLLVPLPANSSSVGGELLFIWLWSSSMFCRQDQFVKNFGWKTYGWWKGCCAGAELFSFP